MKRKRLGSLLFAVLATMALLPGNVRAEELITFSPLSDPKDLRAAKGFLRTRLDQETINTKSRLSSEIWGEKLGTTLDKYLREFVRIGKADIVGDGIPELFLMLADPGFCGTAGCDMFILSVRNRRLNLLCDGLGDEPGVLLTDRKGFKGRREIETAEFHIMWRETGYYVPELEG
jgi:hypothetical protein